MTNSTIAYIIPSLGTGGAELQTINHVNHIHQNELAKVFLISLTQHTPNLKNVQLPREQVFVLDGKSKVLNKSAIINSFKLAKQLRRILNDNGIQTVFAVLGVSQYISRLALRKTKGVNLISYYRGMDYTENPINGLFYTNFNRLNSVLAKRDDKAVFISQAVIKDISGHMFVPEAQLIVSNSIPSKDIDEAPAKTLFAELNIDENCFSLVLPGRVQDKVKGHLFFLPVFKKWIEEHDFKSNDIRLIIAGDGPDMEKVKSVISELELSEFTHCLGYTENSLLLSIMKKANIVAVPSHIEGLGNVVIEAFMAGTIPLTSNAGGLDELIHHGVTGYKFQKGDSGACMIALQEAFENKNNINTGDLENEYQTKYTLQNQINNLLQFAAA